MWIASVQPIPAVPGEVKIQVDYTNDTPGDDRTETKYYARRAQSDNENEAFRRIVADELAAFERADLAQAQIPTGDMGAPTIDADLEQFRADLRKANRLADLIAIGVIVPQAPLDTLTDRIAASLPTYWDLV